MNENEEKKMKKITTIIILCLFGVCSNVSAGTACVWNKNGVDINYYPNAYQTTKGSLEDLKTKNVYLDTCSNIAYLDKYYWTDCKMKTNTGFPYPEYPYAISSQYLDCTNKYAGTCNSRTPVSSCSSVKDPNKCNKSYISNSNQYHQKPSIFCRYEGYCRDIGGYCQ